MELVASATERSTAGTDALLALVCLGCFLQLRRFRDCDAWKVGIWSGAFALLGVGALLGAIAHGFEMADGVRALLWAPLYLSLGLAVALFGTGAVHDMFGPRASRRALPVLVVTALAFFALTLLDGRFLAFVLYEGVVMALALAAYAWLAVTARLPGAGWMAVGIVLSLLAAALQATRIVPRLELVWTFDHNGIFHLVQMPALILLALGLTMALRARPTAGDIRALSLDRA